MLPLRFVMLCYKQSDCADLDTVNVKLQWSEPFLCDMWMCCVFWYCADSVSSLSKALVNWVAGFSVKKRFISCLNLALGLLMFWSVHLEHTSECKEYKWKLDSHCFASGAVPGFTVSLITDPLVSTSTTICVMFAYVNPVSILLLYWTASRNVEKM